MNTKEVAGGLSRSCLPSVIVTSFLGVERSEFTFGDRLRLGVSGTSIFWFVFVAMTPRSSREAKNEQHQGWKYTLYALRKSLFELHEP